MKKRYVVLGSNVSGWISALYLEAINSHRRSDVEILLIDAEGADEVSRIEASTPHFAEYLRHLGISPTDLVRSADATIKNGVKFTNWRGKGDYDTYTHSFMMGVDEGLSIHDMHEESPLISFPGAFAKNYQHSESPDKSNVLALANKFSKVLFSQRAESLYVEDQDPFMLFRELSTPAFHFDTDKLINVLSEVGKSRGVTVLEGNLDLYEQDDFGNVTSLTLDDGTDVACDFIVDASGQDRFSPEGFENDWVSYKEFLTTDTAITFSLMAKKNIPAQTDITAMNAGWMWEMPLLNRYQCGYVFDSNLISADEAKAEVEARLNKEVVIDETISFKSGHYKDTWRKNVLSVGESSGYVDPIESTTIWTTIYQLQVLFTKLEILETTDFYDQAREWYNRTINDVREDVLGFTYFHYMGRQDKGSSNSFWSQYNEENAPEGLKNILQIMKWKTLDSLDIPKSFWPLESWYYIAFGIRYKPFLDSIGRSCLDNYYNLAAEDDYILLKRQQSDVVSNVALGHRYMLEKLGATAWEDLEL